MQIQGIAFVGSLLAEKHLEANVHEVCDRNQGAGTGMCAEFAVTIALVAVHLTGIATHKQFAFNDLRTKQGRGSDHKSQQKGNDSGSFHF